MKTTILFAVVWALSSVACDVSCFGECDDWSDDDCSKEHHSHGGHGNAGAASGGESASGGNASGSESGGRASTSESGGSANSGNSGATTGTAGKGGNPAPVSCTAESDCPRGFNCDYERNECVAADAETCAELSLESDCDNRNDCMSIYAGINCSCGKDCACKGGEPGCVCESFEFFACEPLKN